MVNRIWRRFALAVSVALLASLCISDGANAQELRLRRIHDRELRRSQLNRPANKQERRSQGVQIQGTLSLRAGRWTIEGRDVSITRRTGFYPPSAADYLDHDTLSGKSVLLFGDPTDSGIRARLIVLHSEDPRFHQRNVVNPHVILSDANRDVGIHRPGAPR